MLSTAQILAATNLVEETVDLPELDGSVRIRAFSKATQQAIRAQAIVSKPGQPDEVDNARLELLMFIHGVVEPVFTVDQLAEVGKLPAGIVDRVNKRIITLSGMTEDTVKAAEKSPQA